MFQWWAQIDRIWNQAGTGLLSARGQTISVLVLLTTQAGLLAYSATRHSPTHLEPAFLAAGISHWQFGRFELYRVNPPLPRMIAALPVLAVGCKTDWSHFYDGPGSRAEFSVGEDFIKVNGLRSIELFVYARWACIPFFLIGGYVAYCWANELYGNGAGLMTLVLWTFEPNLLGHAELVTPDSACTSFGIAACYFYWRWLKQPTWHRAGLGGLFLGLAELSKMSWLILFGLWPLLWGLWCCAGAPHRMLRTNKPPLCQLMAILLLAVYLLNFGYAFNGTCKCLKEFTFVSRLMTGFDKAGEPGNRFRGSMLGELVVPVPEHYILGFDSQKRDFESCNQPSYLRGEWRIGGWWYYYLYGLLVKVPVGTLLLLVVTFVARRHHNRGSVALIDELILLTPAVSLLVLVSSQTEFNHHLRYVFPSLAFVLIFLGQSGLLLKCQDQIKRVLTVSLLFYSVLSGLLTYPHQLAYFNELVGGPRNGHNHLLGSSFDWGQDLPIVAGYIDQETKKHNLPVFVLPRSPFAVGAMFKKFHTVAGVEQLADIIRHHSTSGCMVVLPIAEYRQPRLKQVENTEKGGMRYPPVLGETGVLQWKVTRVSPTMIVFETKR